LREKNGKMLRKIRNFLTIFPVNIDSLSRDVPLWHAFSAFMAGMYSSLLNKIPHQKLFGKIMPLSYLPPLDFAGTGDVEICD